MNAEQKSRRHPGIIAAVVIVLMLIAYPLSVGPVGWLLGKFDLSLGTFVSIMGVLYYPLLWLADKSDWFRGVFDWYINLWF